MTPVALQPLPRAADAVLTDVSVCNDVAAWDHYVLARTECPLFHRAAWRTVWNVYGLPSLPLAAWRNGRIVGVLPLVRQASRLTGRQLVSLPWCDGVGILADDDAARSALAQAAMGLTRDWKADSVQIRERNASNLSPHVRTDKLLMELPLERSSETLWKRLSSKVRNQVRKAEKSDLHVAVGKAELLDEFFEVYSRNMRDLGSPSHSPDIFLAVARAFPAEVRVWIVRLGRQAVGAGLTLANGTALEIPWASSLRKANSLCVNHLMYWRILEQACRDGFATFRFGRSTEGSGQHHFKKQWGAAETPLHWYFLSESAEQAQAAAAPPQERLGWAGRIWQRLPLAVSRRVGPKIMAGIP
ncbi:MAG: FemAB family PEP-CTERM system-associated protein [Planctomyces sp.]|nr:FemAB family PEP-CTERM system-associated protein [Planctomyces sp.]